jgi:hypothetical protein
MSDKDVRQASPWKRERQPILWFYSEQWETWRTRRSSRAAIALMVWLYWTGFAMLVGAELNQELARVGKEGKLQEKHEPPSITRIDLAA